MKTINIKGKEYVPVHERVLFFRSEFAGWSIQTDIVSMDSEMAVIKATIYDENGNVKSTGHAYEMQSDKSSFVNKTSYLENCETSAIGRALGCLGIGIENSFASANEVKSAQDNQNNPDLDKPWLSEVLKNKFIDRIRSADYGEFDNAEEMFKKLKETYRMKKVFREAIEAEINDDFNKKLNE